MSEQDKAQESINGVELTGTHGLDIEDMPRGSKEGFNGGALIVKVKGVDHAKLSFGQVGVQQGIVEPPITEIELIQQATDAFLWLDFRAMYAFRNRQPVLQSDGLRQAFCQFAVRSFEDKVTGQARQQPSVIGAIVPRVQASNDLQGGVIGQQQALNVISLQRSDTIPIKSPPSYFSRHHAVTFQNN